MKKTLTIAAFILLQAAVNSLSAQSVQNDLLVENKINYKELSSTKWQSLNITREEATKSLTVSIPKGLAVNSHLNIYNERGTLVMQFNTSEFQKKAKIDLPSDLKKGIYLVEITNEKNPYVQTFTLN